MLVDNCPDNVIITTSTREFQIKDLTDKVLYLINPLQDKDEQGLIQDFTSGILLEKSNNLEKSNMINSKNLTSNSVWDYFFYKGNLPCTVYCIVNKQIRGYQSSITSYNVVCGPPGLHSELLSQSWDKYYCAAL